MWPWILFLGGMSVWGAHFLGVYGIASLFALQGAAEGSASVGWVLAFTLLCLLANAVLAYFLLGRTPDPEAGWRRSVGLLGVGFSTVAILWQALPAIFLA